MYFVQINLCKNFNLLKNLNRKFENFYFLLVLKKFFFTCLGKFNLFYKYMCVCVHIHSFIQVYVFIRVYVVCVWGGGAQLSVCGWVLLMAFTRKTCQWAEIGALVYNIAPAIFGSYYLFSPLHIPLYLFWSKATVEMISTFPHTPCFSLSLRAK